MLQNIFITIFNQYNYFPYNDINYHAELISMSRNFLNKYTFS